MVGRDETFSAGFDLKVMKRGGAETLKMLRAGYTMTARLDARAHEISKQRIRAEVIGRIRRPITLDLKDAVMMGVRAAVGSALSRGS